MKDKVLYIITMLTSITIGINISNIISNIYSQHHFEKNVVSKHITTEKILLVDTVTNSTKDRYFLIGYSLNDGTTGAVTIISYGLNFIDLKLSVKNLRKHFHFKKDVKIAITSIYEFKTYDDYLKANEDLDKLND